MSDSGEIALEYRERRRGSGDYTLEFSRKRDEDLNITLVVAGLLSAVISAFVIAIQPELQPNTGEESVAILRFLLYNANETAFGGDVPTVPEWTGPPGKIVATQVLLYFSLTSTLACVLCGIIARQVSDTRAMIGSRGNDIEQGQKIPFDILRFLFSILHLQLQFSIVSFGWALTVYLWDINAIISRALLVAAISATIPMLLAFVSFTLRFVIVELLRVTATV